MSILWSCVCSICSGYPPASGGIVQPSALKGGVVPVVPRDAARKPNLLRWMGHDGTLEDHGATPIAGTKLTIISFWWQTCAWKNHCLESRVPYNMTPSHLPTLSWVHPSVDFKPRNRRRTGHDDPTRRVTPLVSPRVERKACQNTSRCAAGFSVLPTLEDISGVWPKKTMLLLKWDRAK